MAKIKEYKYIALNKPAGYVCALKDNVNQTIMELVPNNIKGLHIVGRLDKDTTGLIILTNDGNYTHNSTHPKKHVNKRYVVTLENEIEKNYKETIENGMMIDNGDTQLKPGVFDKIDSFNCYLRISEGKFHQVKKMFSALGNHVVKLHRDQFDIYSLAELDIEVGKWKEVIKK